MPVRKPLSNRHAEARFWQENAERLESQPVVHQAFVESSRRHAANLSSTVASTWRKAYRG